MHTQRCIGDPAGQAGKGGEGEVSCPAGKGAEEEDSYPAGHAGEGGGSCHPPHRAKAQEGLSWAGFDSPQRAELGGRVSTRPGGLRSLT